MTSRQKQIILILADAAIVFVSYWLAALLRYDGRIPEEAVSVILLCIVISIPVVVISGFILGCYNDIWKYAGFEAMFRQGILAAISAVILLAVKYIFIEGVSGSISIIYGVLLFVFSAGLRVIPRSMIWIKSLYLTKPINLKRAVIVGAGDTGAMLVRQSRNTRSGRIFYPVAIVDNDEKKHGMFVSGVKIAGSLDSIEEICKEHNADEIIVALPNASKEDLYFIYKKCINANLPIKSYQNLLDVKDSLHEDEMALKLVTIEDLLFRDVIENDMTPVREYIKDRVVMVTGGAGSIGSELCRQALDCGCGLLIIYDFSENGLYDIDEEFQEKYDKSRFVLCLGSIRDTLRLEEVFNKYKPFVVFHAAAHKHVPMLELNPFEAVKNNVIGTRNVIEACIKNSVSKFILISTDKAVNPVNILGASKRVAEMLVENTDGGSTELTAVRFGNVLGSIGSVIPKFKRQIAAGGPVTVTDRNIIRYFMTISEAVSLVLTAGTLAKNGEMFVLDMGQPVKIYDLAVDLIRLSGYEPGVDIKIEITGLRPGEKLYEELFVEDDEVDSTSHEKIYVLRKKDASKETDKQSFYAMYDNIARLAADSKDEEALREALFNLVRGKDD